MRGPVPSTLLFLGLEPGRILEEMHGAGVDSVDINFESLHVHQYPVTRIAGVYREVLEAAQRIGLRVVSVHMPYEEYFLPYLDGGLERVAREAAGLVEEVASRGARVVVFHPFSARFLGSDTLAKAVQVFSRIVEAAEAYGVMVALENTTSARPWNRVEEVYRLARETGATLCIDTGHAHYNGYDVASVLEEYGMHASIVHVHDNDGRIDAHRIPGCGTIDWQRVARVARSLDAIAAVEVQCNPRREPCRARLAAAQAVVRALLVP